MKHDLPSAPWSADAFEQKFRADPDPWGFRDCAYERGRFRTTLRWLGRRLYRRALEAGCANGELTSKLAPRCAELVAFDVSPTALEVAARCCRASNVDFRCVDLARFEPEPDFDLIVLSEVGYYFTGEQLAQIARRLASGLEAGGELLAVHWTGQSFDHRLGGDEVHRILARTPGLFSEGGASYPGFRVDRWRRS